MVQNRSRRQSLARALTSGLAMSALVVMTAFAQADTNPVPPDGYWFTKGSESIVRVLPCSDIPPAGPVSPAKAPAVAPSPGDPPSFCGMVVWLKDPLDAKGRPKIDSLNHDPAKKDKPIVGLEILFGMVPKDDHWAGQAYNPDDGKFYEITFKVKTDKTPNDEADLRGCVLKILCQTETFTRTADVPGGDPTLTAVSTASKPARPHGMKKDASSK